VAKQQKLNMLVSNSKTSERKTIIGFEKTTLQLLDLKYILQ
jgi:hypothetical protein